jgi:hypothetical protein
MKTINLTVEQARAMYGKDGAIDTMLRANFSDKELGIKPALPKRWEDIGVLSGYYITDECKISGYLEVTSRACNKNMLPTNKVAEGVLVECQLLMLRDIYRQGWKPDWSDGTLKYCIFFFEGSVAPGRYIDSAHIFAFQSEEIRDEFLENFNDLLTQYARYIL